MVLSLCGGRPSAPSTSRCFSTGKVRPGWRQAEKETGTNINRQLKEQQHVLIFCVSWPCKSVCKCPHVPQTVSVVDILFFCHIALIISSHLMSPKYCSYKSKKKTKLFYKISLKKTLTFLHRGPESDEKKHAGVGGHAGGRRVELCRHGFSCSACSVCLQVPHCHSII